MIAVTKKPGAVPAGHTKRVCISRIYQLSDPVKQNRATAKSRAVSEAVVARSKIVMRDRDGILVLAPGKTMHDAREAVQARHKPEYPGDGAFA
jgi:hypothetical protein